MEKLNFLDEVILDDSEMLEICGGTSVLMEFLDGRILHALLTL